MSANNLDWSTFPLRIGCPVWRSPDWVGTVYRHASEIKHAVHSYSQLFPTVEGNSTFYSLPSLEQVRKWSDSATKGFHFCFKVPRRISHELELRQTNAELREFLSRMEILLATGNLGPIFLQMGPNFSSRQWSDLESFIQLLPSDFPWAVELRHPDWFDSGRWQTTAESLLRQRNIDRVLFDASYLHSNEPRTAAEIVSRTRKPNVPRIDSVTSVHPMVRLIGHDLLNPADAEKIVASWDGWIDTFVAWIESGLRPYVFVHTPNDAFAPTLCHALYSAIQTRAKLQNSDVKLPELPALKSRPTKPQQATFNFDD